MTTPRTNSPRLWLTITTVAGVSLLNSLSNFAADAPSATDTTKNSTSVAAANSTTARQPETARSPEPKSILLRYQFKKGQFVHYEEQSRSEMTLMAREQTQATRENRKTNKHFRVVSVDENGSAVIEPIIDRVQMEVHNDGDPTVTYDSADGGKTSKDFETVEETIGKPSLRIRYSANGQIEQLLPLVPSESGKVSPEEQEKQNFLIAFPEAPVSVGEAWTDNYMIDVSVDGKLRNPLTKRVKVRRTYTLKDVKDDVASIQFRTYPLAVEHDPQVKVQLVHHSRFGSIQFDIKRGIILEWKSSGSGQVFNAFGPASSMKALSSTVEKYIASPSTAKQRRSSPRRRPGPAGPQLPGTASL